MGDNRVTCVSCFTLLIGCPTKMQRWPKNLTIIWVRPLLGSRKPRPSGWRAGLEAIPIITRGEFRSSAPKQIRERGRWFPMFGHKEKPRRSGAKCTGLCGRRGIGLPQLGNSERGDRFLRRERSPPECCRRTTDRAPPTPNLHSFSATNTLKIILFVCV